MKTVPGLLAEPADTRAKNLLPSSRNPPCLCPCHCHPETARLPWCPWCWCSADKETETTTSWACQLIFIPAFVRCTMTISHGTWLICSQASARSLLWPWQISVKLRFDQFDVIKRSGWRSVSSPLVVLHKRKNGLMNTFGSYCVTLIRLKGLWLPTATERREYKNIHLTAHLDSART